MEIQLGAVKRIHGLLKTEAESYEGLLGEGQRRARRRSVFGLREPGGGGHSSISAVAHTWQLTLSPAPSTITDPEELAGPGEDPDPELECALRQLPEACAEACQRPHLPRTEGQGHEGIGLAVSRAPDGPPGLTPIQSPQSPGPRSLKLTRLSPPLPSLSHLPTKEIDTWTPQIREALSALPFTCCCRW